MSHNNGNDTRLVEYQAAQDCYLHYDNFPWQVGALLIAGVFVFWGLVIDSSAKWEILGPASLLVSLLMSVWILYAHHNRQIYLCKLDRARELERELGMEQHRRFKWNESTERKYKVFGLKGHYLDLVIFALASVGGPLLGYLKEGPNLWLLPPVLVVGGTLAWIWRNERCINSWLER